MVKIVLVNGRPGCGKTTFEEQCKLLKYYASFSKKETEKREYAVSISTIDVVKEIAEFAGWDGTKTPENRKFLSDLKKLLVEWNDVPYQTIKKFIDEYDKTGRWIIFIDSREPEEIERFKKDYNATTLLIRRLGDEAIETSNGSDAGVFDYDYDYVIKNYGDLGDLREQAITFLEYLEEKEFYGRNN